MVERTFETNSLHDKVVCEIRNALNQNDYDIYLNTGQQKNAGIKDLYPDVIMTLKGTPNVKFILEVETGDSVNRKEALEQWKKYSEGINATFYLVVPESFAFKAKELCQEMGINARFATYTITPENRISFHFK